MRVYLAAIGRGIGIWETEDSGSVYVKLRQRLRIRTLSVSKAQGGLPKLCLSPIASANRNGQIKSFDRMFAR